MNDEKIEQLLREFPAPELPSDWQGTILANARRDARSSKAERQAWPAVLLYLRNLCARNPATATAMIALWTLILFLKVSTPIDPQEKELMAHYDPNKPVYFVSINDQILIAQMELDQSRQQPLRRMP